METQRAKYNSVRVGDRFAVVRPERRLVGDDETDEFRAIVKQLNHEQRDFIVVDLGEIDWVNTTGITALIYAHLMFTKRGGHVLLARLDKRIHNMLIIAKLTMVFDVYSAVEEAIAAGLAMEVRAADAPA
jgi:anti-sigma B factor antagonist